MYTAHSNTIYPWPVSFQDKTKAGYLTPSPFSVLLEVPNNRVTGVWQKTILRRHPKVVAAQFFPSQTTFPCVLCGPDSASLWSGAAHPHRTNATINQS